LYRSRNYNRILYNRNIFNIIIYSRIILNLVKLFCVFSQLFSKRERQERQIAGVFSDKKNDRAAGDILRRKTMPDGDERIFPLAAKHNARFLRAPVGGRDVIAFAVQPNEK